MKKIATLLLVFSCLNAKSQLQTITNPNVVQGILVKITPPLKDFKPDPNWVDEIVRDENGLIGEDKERPENRLFHPNAISKPKGKDPIVQDYFFKKKGRGTSIIQNFMGHPNTTTSPADPSLCVGPNHVIQMVNGTSGGRFIVYNKSGTIVMPAQYMDAISGVSGAGDPVALYDQFADRFVLTEFSNSGNDLIVMMSQTNDPAGSWFVYQFTTPEFPDYPHYGIWSNAIICTTNESSNSVYAFDKTAMLAGTVTTNMISFTIPHSASVGFQAAAPVNISGTNLPPSGTKPLVMRMTDDGWGGGATDALEMWEMNLNFATPGSSILAQLPSLSTAPFTSDLCGYSGFNCIRQPGSKRLDPIRELIMNRVWYRNFNTHQSIVLNHSVDATGLDQAGIRWYELRRNGLGPWSIYQQSTYAPDTNSRWMGTIAINGAGSIALAYSVSSKTVFPSFRFTGRQSTDPLNILPETEEVIAAGATNHTVNRWGDYADMQVDPSNDLTFWTTAMYMPNPAPWSTRIAALNIFPVNYPLALPFNLLAFDGQKNAASSVRLNWQTEHESQLSHFDIERSSSDNGNFERINKVTATHFETVNDYAINDNTTDNQKDYQYRLKMINFDGQVRYSHVVTIKGKDKQRIEIYPNPVTSNILFMRIANELSGAELTYQLYNLNGQIVATIFKTSLQTDLVQRYDMSSLQRGPYIMKCIDSKGETLGKITVIKN